MKRLCLLLVLGIACAAAHGKPASPPVPHYTITDLGTLGGGESDAHAINNKGQIVGVADTAAKGPDGEYIPYVFVYERGHLRKVNKLQGNFYYATALNDKGQLVGGFKKTPRATTYQPYLYANGRVSPLGPLPGGDIRISEARAINNRGQIVGVSGERAFLYDHARLRALANPPKFTTGQAFAINSSWVIVGSGVLSGARGAFLHSRALRWVGGKATNLGTLPGFDDSEAHAINTQGQIVGWASMTSGNLKYKMPVSHAFLWANGHLRDLGVTLGAQDNRANAINDHGAVVGRAVRANQNIRDNEYAVLWLGGRPHDLNALTTNHAGWHLQEAVGINNAGWIVGNGKHNGHPHAFLLMPR